MKVAVRLLKRLGLFADKAQVPDSFDLRLKRIGARESRIVPQKVLFRPSLPLQEA